MTRLTWFAAAVAAALGGPVAAQPAVPPALPPLGLPANLATAVVTETVVDLGRGVYVVTGALNNTTVIVGSTGLIVIDTQFAPRFPAISARIAAISSKPIVEVINTHYHYDHTGGNAAFRRAGAKIVAQVNVAKRMQAPPADPLTGLPDTPAAADALPTDSYVGDGATRRAGGVDYRLIHPAPAHTDGDSIVVLAAQDVVATGDIVGNHYPNIDVAVGGGIDGMIRAVDLILGLVTDSTRVIPGHGPVLARPDVVAYRTMLQTARDRIARAKAAGMTEEQVMAANLLADLDARWKGPSPMANRFPINIYRSLP